MNLKLRWLITGGIAMSLLGIGLSIIGDAVMNRVEGVTFAFWFLEGLAGLILFNSGIGTFGKAVLLRWQLDHQNADI